MRLTAKRRSFPLIRTIIARSAADMDCLAPTWRSLYVRQQSTLFQSFAWNRLAARAFLAIEQPYCVMASTDSGAAIIPAAIGENGRKIVILGETLFDYRDVLAGGDEDALRRAWGELARLGLTMSVTAVRSSAVPHWHGLGLSPFAKAPQVRRVETSAEEFESNHRRLGRLFRRCEKAGAKLVQCDGRESKFLRWIYRQKALQLAGRKNNLFTNERRIAFLVAAAAMKPNRCEIFTLESGSTIVASLVTFRDGDVRRFYTSYFNDEWARHSPGQLLIYEVTRRSLAAGLDCDYMTGEQQHKTRLATSGVPLFRVDATVDMLKHAATAPEREVAA